MRDVLAKSEHDSSHDRDSLTKRERAADETRDIFGFQLLDPEMLENRVDSALST